MDTNNEDRLAQARQKSKVLIEQITGLGYHVTAKIGLTEDRTAGIELTVTR